MKILFCVLCSFMLAFNSFDKNQESIPIYFSDFSIEIGYIPKLNDTLIYKNSSKEDFKFVFFDLKGICYCERFINKKLYQKGYFENSLDTLKRYISGRAPHGQSSAMWVQKYFEPLKNGEWITYKNGKQIKENYVLGIR